jgi:hypothetical protein
MVFHKKKSKLIFNEIWYGQLFVVDQQVSWTETTVRR